MRLHVVIFALSLPVIALAANGPTAVKNAAPKKDEKKIDEKPAEKADTKPDLPQLSPSGQKESSAPPPSTDGGVPASAAKTDVGPETKTAKAKYFEGMSRTPEEQKQLEEITEAPASLDIRPLHRPQLPRPNDVLRGANSKVG
jgi:hypothetical protein